MEKSLLSLSLSLSLSESISRLCVGIRACITQRKTTREEDVGDVENYMITLTETVRFFSTVVLYIMNECKTGTEGRA